MKSFYVAGRHFQLHPADNKGCAGCAFEGPEPLELRGACLAAGEDCMRGRAYPGGGIWIEQEGAPAPASKDTNPKDAIGARKAKMSVVPSGVLFELGLGMLEGTCKYGRHNYRVAGVRASVYYDAAMGHLMDFWEGEDIDPDSGRLHLVKAMASIAVWLDALQQGKLTDDRPPRSKVHKSDFNQAAADIIDRHADKNPRHYTIADTP